MTDTVDFQRINQSALGIFETLLSRWFPSGKKQGNEYKVGSLAGEPGDSLSINIRQGVWSDFASGESGSDPVSLFAAMRSVKMIDAARQLNDEIGAGGVMGAPPPDAKKKTNQEWVAITPVPDNAPSPVFRDFHYGEPEAVWTYQDISKRVIGYIRRFRKTQSEGKEIRPLCWAQNSVTKEYAWRPLAFPDPRPLYGLELIADRLKASVLVVEGEKAADAARTIFSGIVVTWPGGANAVKKTDWTPLKGRKVFIWPDADEPGHKAASVIREILGAGTIIKPPENVAEGWDLADAVAEGWTENTITEFIAAQMAKPQLPEPDHTSDWPFVILGHDRGDFYYMSKVSKQVVRLTARSHQKNEFLALAPLDWWEQTFPGKDGCSWLMATNTLMQRCLPVEFDIGAIRGRGAWIDGDNVIYHAGDKLIVNGENEIAIDSTRGKYVYERGKRLSLELGSPASDSQANKLRKLCHMLPTKHVVDAEFLAGWMVVAPICGVLNWRPHLWVTGGSGTGKSTTMSGIIRPMLGKTAIVVQGATTEAGIRQKLKRDALPILFDEAESEDKQDQHRIQNILNLARSSSSDNDGEIAKGTASGDGQSYIIRSAFCFASIAVAAYRRADRSRITLVELVKNENQIEADTQYETLKQFMTETTLDAAFCEAIRTRSLLLAPVIVKNAATFSRVAAKYLGTQRDGDQVGVLLAGSYSLQSSRIITIEEADNYCSKQDWSPWKYEAQDMDEHRCFSQLMEAIIPHQDGDKPSRVSVAELIQQATCGLNDTMKGYAKLTLERHGIAVRRDGVDVSDSHSELRKIFSDTPFAGKWKDQLKRLHGAETKSTSEFCGNKNRAVRLPRSMFIRSEKLMEESYE